jgi:hypothetical protein
MREGSHTVRGRARRARVLLAGVLALASCVPRQQPDGPPRYPAGAAIPGSARMTTVDPATGASLASDDGVLTIYVPPGAVSTATDFSIQDIVNTAPGTGTSYRIGPVGVSFAQPVTLTFRPSASGSVAGLTVMTRDPVTGYWTAVQQNLVVDTVAGTLTVTVTSFAVSDWSLVAAATANDFFGTFSLSESLEYSLSAAGAAFLAYAGSSGDVMWYIVPGSIALSSASVPVAGGTASCSANPPSVPLPTSVAELNLVKGRFDFGINGRWDTTCSDSVDRILAATFDTLGVNLNYCSPPVLAAGAVVASDHLLGSMTVDCNALGWVTASWNFQTCPGVDGASCTASDCHVAAISCATGGPICNDTGVLADGTPCGSVGHCLGGVCGP